MWKAIYLARAAFKFSLKKPPHEDKTMKDTTSNYRILTFFGHFLPHLLLNKKKRRRKKNEERSSFQVSGELKTILNGTFAREVFMYYPEGNGTLLSFLRDGRRVHSVGEFSGYVSVSIGATTRRLTDHPEGSVTERKVSFLEIERKLYRNGRGRRHGKIGAISFITGTAIVSIVSTYTLLKSKHAVE